MHRENYLEDVRLNVLKIHDFTLSFICAPADDNSNNNNKIIIKMVLQTRTFHAWTDYRKWTSQPTNQSKPSQRRKPTVCVWNSIYWLRCDVKKTQLMDEIHLFFHMFILFVYLFKMSSSFISYHDFVIKLVPNARTHTVCFSNCIKIDEFVLFHKPQHVKRFNFFAVFSFAMFDS